MKRVPFDSKPIFLGIRFSSFAKVYASRTGETRGIGEIIAEGLRFSTVDVTLKDVREIKTEKDLAGYDGYAFGSSTYHGEMMAGMKTFLFLAQKADLKGKKGAAFGSYGWSGEAAERIFDTMKHIYGRSLDAENRFGGRRSQGGTELRKRIGCQNGRVIDVCGE